MLSLPFLRQVDRIISNRM